MVGWDGGDEDEDSGGDGDEEDCGAGDTDETDGGGTDAYGFAHALEVAHHLTTKSINDSIKEDFRQVQLDMESHGQVAIG